MDSSRTKNVNQVASLSDLFDRQYGNLNQSLEWQGYGMWKILSNTVCLQVITVLIGLRAFNLILMTQKGNKECWRFMDMEGGWRVPGSVYEYCLFIRLHVLRSSQEVGMSKRKKLRGLSPRTNYTDRETAACRRR
jgi:hypothetical protein